MNIPFVRSPGSNPETYILAPSKIVAIGVNYRAHAAEMGREVPEEPLMFLKAPSSVIGSGGEIRLPAGIDPVHHECELAVVIGTRASCVSREDALRHVLGYTCLNDVSSRALQKRDGQWTRAKSFDTFCPVGPRVIAGLDPTDLRLQTRVNGETRQDSSTSDMIFSVAHLLEFITSVMTLEVGDVVTTGTPPGVGPLVPGDDVEVEIAGIGILKNRVVAR